MLRRRHAESAAESPVTTNAPLDRIPFVGDQPVRADRGLEARLPVARLAQRPALARGERGDQKPGQRDGGDEALHLELGLAEELVDDRERTLSLRRVQHRDQRAHERRQRRAARAPRQRDDAMNSDRKIGERRSERAAEAIAAGCRRTARTTMPRNSAQAIAPPTNSGIVIPPERFGRKPAHVTITGATRSAPTRVAMNHTLNVRIPSRISARDRPRRRERAPDRGLHRRPQHERAELASGCRGATPVGHALRHPCAAPARSAPRSPHSRSHRARCCRSQLRRSPRRSPRRPAPPPSDCGGATSSAPSDTPLASQTVQASSGAYASAGRHGAEREIARRRRR